MPKGFTERERTLIRAQLLAKGKQLFGAHGLKKTNVEDLTQAVGISKGAFYLFFESKEALFFELLRQFETEYRETMLRDIAQADLAPQARFKAMLAHSLLHWKDNPLFANFGAVEFEQLVRKLPEQQIAAHLQDDIEFADEFIAACARSGVEIRVAPNVVTGLLRAVIFLHLHEEDIGADVHSEVIAILIDQIATYLVKA